MARVTFLSPSGERYEVDAQPGFSLMRAAVDNDVPGIEAACGGSMVCGTCHAYIDKRWWPQLPVQSEGECEMLEYGMHIRPESRLTCQISVQEEMEGMEVFLPDSQR